MCGGAPPPSGRPPGAAGAQNKKTRKMDFPGAVSQLPGQLGGNHRYFCAYGPKLSTSFFWAKKFLSTKCRPNFREIRDVLLADKLGSPRLAAMNTGREEVLSRPVRGS